MPTTTSKRPTESALKPWHIVLFVIAGVLVLWQVANYVNGVRAANNFRDERTVHPHNFPPGSTRARQEEEK
jgi:hypothetical protein